MSIPPSFSRTSGKRGRTCPYVGLIPFTEADASYFAGRERETKLVCTNLSATHLTVLYGPSGIGKSSLLQAGVMPRLRRTRQNSAVVYFRGWQNPRFAVEFKMACVQAVKDVASHVNVALDLPLNVLLARLAEGLQGTIFVLLDQFEEYLIFQSESAQGKAFESELVASINDEDECAHFLLGLREETVCKLDRLDRRIPNLMNNILRLKPIDAAGASAALREPLQRYNQEHRKNQVPVTIEDALVEEIVAETSGDRARFTDGASAEWRTQAHSRVAPIELAFLQLVMIRIWDTEMKSGSPELRRSTLVKQLRGAAAVVRTYFDKVMQAFSASEQVALANIFGLLVTNSGNKISYTVDELAEPSQLPKEQLSFLLQKLAGFGVLRAAPTLSLDDANALRYEIQHDKLAAAVLDWRKRFNQERHIEQARKEWYRALLRRTALGLAALILMGAVAVSYYRDHQRKREVDDANAQRDQARAQAIAPRLVTAVSEAMALAASREVVPVGNNRSVDEVESRARRIAHGVDRLLRRRLPEQYDERTRAIVNSAMTVPESTRFVDLSKVVAFSVSPDGKMLALGSDTGRVALIPRDPKQAPYYAPGQGSGYRSIGFLVDPKGDSNSEGAGHHPVAMLRNVARSGTGLSVDLSMRPASKGSSASIVMKQFTGSTKDGEEAAYLSCDGRHVTALGLDEIGVWDLSTRRQVWHEKGAFGEVISADVARAATDGARGGLVIAYATLAGRIKVQPIDADSNQLQVEWVAHEPGPTLVALSPQGTNPLQLASAGVDGVAWWPRGPEQLRLALPIPGRANRQATWTRLVLNKNASRLAAQRSDGLVVVWSLESNPRLLVRREFAFPRLEAAFSPDLDYIAIFANRGLNIYPLTTEQPTDPALSEDVSVHADEYADALGGMIPELVSGIQAANDGKFDSALKWFGQLRNYPGVEFEALSEAQRLRTLALTVQLKDRLAKDADVAQHEAWLQSELSRAGISGQAAKQVQHLLGPALVPAYVSRALKKIIAPSELKAAHLSADVYLEALSDMLKAEELDPHTPLPALYWNNLCWWGSVSGYAKQLARAGERAVELAPAEANFRDTRGVARALIGDFAGAKADFEFFVADAYVQRAMPDEVAERRKWIRILAENKNPLNKATLENLMSD